MEILSGPTKLGKILPIPLPYSLFLFCGNVFRISSKGNIWENTEKYNETLRGQLWVKLIFDVLKLIHSYHIRIMNVHMGQKIIYMI
jgi:hypothetical protein